ncbi:MAG: transaldolase family protein [Coriobacteriia bacterium]|nr:transaldolase family protein [Coriobacteriia bacterium]
MKILIDSANLEKINHIVKYFPIDGITTNPSILCKENTEPYELLEKLKQIKDLLFVQAISKDFDGMVEEAKRITDKLGDVVIKIPVTDEGLRAIKHLSAQGYHTCGTAIYTEEQAFMAALAGAEYVAPYVNRIEKFYGDGIGTVKNIQEIYKNNNLKTKILAASFKRNDQVMALAKAGVDAATIPADLLINFIHNKDVDEAVDAFVNDFYKLVGPNSTM